MIKNLKFGPARYARWVLSIQVLSKPVEQEGVAHNGEG